MVKPLSNSKSKVTIIGSGITGLAVGASLAKNGLEVRVLEGNYELGGHARSFNAEGFWFCAGPQYLWNFTEGAIGHRFLEHLGISGKVPVDPMNSDGFERCYIGDDDYIDIPMGLDRFKDMLFTRFPAEQRRIAKFFREVENIFRGCTPLNDRAAYQHSAPRIFAELVTARRVGLGAKFKTALFTTSTLKQLYDRCGLSENLRRVLYAHGGIFLENESTASAIAYGASTGFYHSGAGYPRYGFRSLIDSLRDVIVESGGSVETGKKVSRLSVRKNTIRSGLCEDGEEFETDFVISNAAPGLVARMVSDGNPRLKYRYSPSHPVISCFIGLADYPEIEDILDRRNIWWQDGNGEVEYHDVDMLAPPRMLYVCSPTCNGSHNQNDQQNKHSLMIFTPGNYEQAMEAHRKGEEAYDTLLRRIEENHLEQIQNRLLPKIKQHMRYVKVSTPVETELHLGAELGNVYGRRATPKSLLTHPVTANPFANLRFACATTGAAGIASGIQTAAVLAEDLIGVSV